MTLNAVLLDTSFFLRLLNSEDPLCNNAEQYFKYFLDKEIEMWISTISIAEYCVHGKLNELPLKHIRVLPFNIDHSQKAGELAAILFSKRKEGEAIERLLIQNDVKLFAQCEVLKEIGAYITSDSRSKKLYDILKSKATIGFDFIDIVIPHTESFGILDLE